MARPHPGHGVGSNFCHKRTHGKPPKASSAYRQSFYASNSDGVGAPKQDTTANDEN